MNKAGLVAKIAEKTGSPKTYAQKSLDAALESIVETIKTIDKVSLVGFGTFSVTSRAARTGSNPKTGEQIEIAASKSGKFYAGKELKNL